jgi:CO/xanthine dehydrogenase Mo-binding subunit
MFAQRSVVERPAIEHHHYPQPFEGRKPGPSREGRGVAAGFWFNRGGETTGTLNVATDGSITLILGTSDVAGSRISIRMMAAEELGIPVDKVRAVMADTHSLGFNRVTAGSRTTFATGMVIVDSARKAITVQARRANLGYARRRRNVRGRLLPACKLQRRHLRADVDRADRGEPYPDGMRKAQIGLGVANHEVIGAWAVA